MSVIERHQIEKLIVSLARQEREAAAIAARCREEGNEEAALFNTGMVAGYSVARLSLMTLIEQPAARLEVVR